MTAVNTTGAKILVVEDESTIADEIESTLQELGYDVIARASSGDEAIRSAGQFRPDMVLMDIRLRGLRDGIQTAEELRDRFHTPVVFLSAHADEVTLRRAKRSSPYGYVVKPFKMSDLRTAVEIALERHALETRVRESERWLSTTLHSIGDAVLCTDLGHAVTFMNAQAELMTGCNYAAARGKPVEEILRVRVEGRRSEVRLPVDDAIRDKITKVPPGDLRLRHCDGQERPIDLSVAPIVEGEKALGAVLVFRDLTDKRALQRRLEFADRLAALGTMAAGVAHEVNNPLAVIMANLALLDQELVPEAPATDGRAGPSPSPSGTQPTPPLGPVAVREILRDTSSAADRLRRIVADLRSFTQPTDDEHGPADLNRAVRWALQSTAHEFRHRARVLADLRALPPVEGSEVRLGQVFVNLLVNAAHAIAPGHALDNEVRVLGYTDASGRAVIEVRDTGSGIPADMRMKIFDPFFTTKPPGLGTGLGLSVCHGIISSLGGDISVESEIGRGSTFRVVMPPVLASGDSGKTLLPAPSTRTARARVLVIDDEPLVRRAIERSLDREHDVVSTATAGEALTRIEGGEIFDLILCDLMMPEMTGMEMASRLRQDLPRVADRLVFLSGGAFTPDAAEFLRSAGTRYIEKPFLPDDLRRKVQELIVEIGLAAPA